jgi:hypothetical protein
MQFKIVDSVAIGAAVAIAAASVFIILRDVVNAYNGGK